MTKTEVTEHIRDFIKKMQTMGCDDVTISALLLVYAMDTAVQLDVDENTLVRNVKKGHAMAKKFYNKENL